MRPFRFAGRAIDQKCAGFGWEPSPVMGWLVSSITSPTSFHPVLAG
jgi:hypothetical protein